MVHALHQRQRAVLAAVQYESTVSFVTSLRITKSSCCLFCRAADKQRLLSDSRSSDHMLGAQTNLPETPALARRPRIRGGRGRGCPRSRRRRRRATRRPPPAPETLAMGGHTLLVASARNALRTDHVRFCDANTRGLAAANVRTQLAACARHCGDLVAASAAGRLHLQGRQRRCLPHQRPALRGPVWGGRVGEAPPRLGRERGRARIASGRRRAPEVGRALLAVRQKVPAQSSLSGTPVRNEGPRLWSCEMLKSSSTRNQAMVPALETLALNFSL